MISAIVLAAGQSKRMGRQKMLMPWGRTTVIGKVISTLVEAGVVNIHVVTGGNQDELKDALREYNIQYIQNKDFANGEMLASVKVGLISMGKESEAALNVLGDQPQIEYKVIQIIVERYIETHNKIIVPSYQMHRGHPWLVEKSYWKEILNLTPPATLRDFLISHNDVIDYVNVDSQSVLQDLDTQADYSQFKP
jgi:molybdenum cofactor cytidylyltransferase